MTHTLPILLLFLVPHPASAQDRPVHDTAMWARFQAFETRLLAQPVRPDAAAALNEYRLVWVEHNNGYFTSLAPGDSTITLETLFPKRIPGYPGATEDLTFRGDRFALHVADIPVSMLDITRRFFERR